METIKFREGRPEDAPQIAELVVQAMTDECCAFFHGADHTREDFVHFMTSLAERDDTQYSYRNTICAVGADDAVLGVCVSYDGARLRELRQVFIDGVRRRFGGDFSAMQEETGPGELYLDSLAVFRQYRGRGIAGQLIAETARKAGRLGCGPLGLLVDYHNPDAERLYVRVGFRHVGDTTFAGHKMKHMQMA